jgi:cold shock CspA family protein
MAEETHDLSTSMEECSINNVNKFGEYIGCVKWFSKSKGFGFVKIISDCEWKEQDMFLHYTNIKSDNFKVVYPGEYISLNIVMDTSKNKNVCSDVTGIMGNKLLIDNVDYNYRVYSKNSTNYSTNSQ